MVNKVPQNVRNTPPVANRAAGPAANQQVPGAARAQPTTPVSRFMPYPIARDGDCLYRSLLMGLQNTVDPASVPNSEVVALRKKLADYTQEFSQELESTLPFLIGVQEDGTHGVTNAAEGVRDLLNTLSNRGHWAGHSGDFVPALAAQLTGRELRILRSIDGDSSHYTELPVIPAYSSGMPGADMSDNLPPIYLFQDTSEEAEHFDFLLERSAGSTTVVNTVSIPNQMTDYDSDSGSSRISHTESATPRENVMVAPQPPAGLQSDTDSGPESASIKSSTDLFHSASSTSSNSMDSLALNNELLIILTEDYSPYIEKHLFGDQSKKTDGQGGKDIVDQKKTLKGASPAQIQKVLEQLEKDFDAYTIVVMKLEKEEGQYEQFKGNAGRLEIKKLKMQKTRLEDSVGNNTSRKYGISQREDKQGMLKALNLINGRMGLALAQRCSDPTDLDSDTMRQCMATSSRLAEKLREKPDFKTFNMDKLNADISMLPGKPDTPDSTFIYYDLLGNADGLNKDTAVSLKTANKSQLNKALENLEGVFRSYIGVTAKVDKEKAKSKPSSVKSSEHIENNKEYRNDVHLKEFRQIKRAQEDRVEVNRHGGRQAMLKAMNLVHAKVLQALANPTLEQSALGGAAEQGSLTAKDKLSFAQDLRDPYQIKYSKEKLGADLDELGIRGIPGVEVEPKSPYETLSEKYPTLVNGDSVNGDSFNEGVWVKTPPLKEANPAQLHKALKKLNRTFSEFSKNTQTIQTEEVKYRTTSVKKLLEKSRLRAQKLEDRVGNNIANRHGLTKREGPLGMLKAMNIMHGRMTLEYQRLYADSANKDSAAMVACEAEIKTLGEALEKPDFKFDNDKLITNMAKLDIRLRPPHSSAGPTSEDLLVTLTEAYTDFVNDVLFKGVTTLESAEQSELNDAFENLGKVFRHYSDTVVQFDTKTNKREVAALRLKKRRLENIVDYNMTKTHGISKRDDRQEMLKALNLLYARIDQELEKRFPQVEGSESTAQNAVSFNKLALAAELRNPVFAHDVDKLAEDRALFLPKDPGIAEKMAAMQRYIDDTANTIVLLSTKGNTAGALSKIWQSKEVDSIVSEMQVKLEKLKKKPTLIPSDTTVVAAGVKANKIFEQCYRQIADVAKKQSNSIINKAKRDTGKVQARALGVLSDTAHLGAQHHLSSHQGGLVTGVNVASKISLPSHVKTRIGTAPTPGVSVSASASANVGISASVFCDEIGSISGVVNAKSNSTMSIVRAGDGNVFGANTTEISYMLGLSLNVGTTDPLIDHGVEELKIPKGVGAAGKITNSIKIGSIGLGSEPIAMLSAHHAPKLSKGGAIGGSVGRFSQLTRLEDVFGNRKLAGISTPSLNRGYNNDQEVAAGFQSLLRDDVETIYDHEGKAPLGQLFTLTSLVTHKLTPQAAAIDGQEKSAMSEFFPDPLWVSRDYTQTNERYDFVAEASLFYKNKEDGFETQGDFFDIEASKTFFKTQGLQLGGAISKTWSKVSRTVRSPKLPHDVFRPKLTQSIRHSVLCAKNYYAAPSSAEMALSKPIAKIMGFVDERGFGDVPQYFEAMAGSFDNGGPQVIDIDAPKQAKLTRLYENFQKDIKLIDKFYLEPQASFRDQIEPEVKKAIKRINREYGALLPSLDDTNLGDLQVQSTNPITKSKRYTTSYQQFQDTAVAILVSFSAVGGAMELMALHHKNDQQEIDQLTMLNDTARSLLDLIDLRAMPWNKNEIASRSTYVRQVVAKPFSHSVETTATFKAEGSHTIKGGDFNLTKLFIKDRDPTALLEQSSTGLGLKATRRHEIAILADNVTDPGQTGRTEWTTDTYRKLKKPFRDVAKQTTTEGKIKEMLLHVFTYKKEEDFRQVQTKTQAYTAKASDTSNPKIKARKFTAHSVVTEREERGVAVRVGVRIPAGPLNIPISVRKSEDKNDYELKSFTYGNDVGAMAIMMTKFFADNKILLSDVQKKVTESVKKGRPLAFIDSLDQRVADAILGDEHYDHMSAILSKFRNSAFVVGSSTVDRGNVLLVPEVDDEGMVILDSIEERVGGKLHNSKKQEMYSTAERIEDDAAPKKYIDRSGFFGYVVARYDNKLLQDGYKHWVKNYGDGVKFPSVRKIDERLSSLVEPTEGEAKQTRQQWLKAASPQERKEFYQNHDDGKKMLRDYLKVLSLAGSINDTIFQTNTYQIGHDEKQVERINKFFTSADSVGSRSSPS